MFTSTLNRFLLSILVGSMGGLIFYLLNLPLPWLLGALSATLISSISGAPVEVNDSIRNYIIAVLGIMLGGTFSPDIIEHIPDWVPTLIAAVFYIIVVSLAAHFYCRKFARMDKITSLFAGLPGGLSEMIILGEEAGADVKRIAINHALRVVCVLLFIPFFLTYGMDISDHIESAKPKYWDFKDAGILLLIGIISVFGSKYSRLPAHRLTFPLILSSILYLNGFITTVPPDWIDILIQLLLGSAIGSRFFGISFKEVFKIMGLAMGMTVVMLSVTIIAASLLSALTGISFPALLLALAPGGFAEMALAALSMGIDPAFVTTHHAIRLFAIVFVTPVIIKLWVR